LKGQTKNSDKEGGLGEILEDWRGKEEASGTKSMRSSVKLVAESIGYHYTLGYLDYDYS
jgi:hypothetical protein